MTKQLLMIVAAFGLLFSNCTKECEETPPETEKNREELLTAHPWKIEELRYLRANTTRYYKRGGSTNNENFDDEFITFHADHTGSYVDGLGNAPFTLTWQFVNTEKTKMNFTIQYVSSPPLTVNWENITLTENLLKYTEYYTSAAGNLLAVGHRITK